MFDGLDLRKPGSQFHHFNFVMRRVFLVMLALFWRDYPWFQIIGFMTLSVGNATYLIYADPLIVESFEDIINNFMEILNECFVMVQSYITMCILFALDADQNYIMNEALTGVIRAQLAVNFFWIFRSIANSTKDEWKLRLRKKYGMTFGDLYKKRKGLYRKLNDEDVELMRAREEKKVARR